MTEDVSSEDYAPISHQIEAEFYSAKGGKVDPLINNSDSSLSQDGKNRWYSFSFAKPVYLTGLSIACEGYAGWHSFELIVEHVDGTQHEESVSVNNGLVSLKLGKLSTSFRFRPEARRLVEPKINRVSATGYSLDEFHKFEWAIQEFEKKTEELQLREQRNKDLSESMVELRAEKVSLESEIGKSRVEREQLSKSINLSQSELAELVVTQGTLRIEVGEIGDSLKVVKAELNSDERKRDELVRELRLFPSEIAGFVKEGNSNIKWYLALSAPFAIILFIVLHSLFSNSIDLTQLWKKDQGVDVWVIFLTRIPFVVVAVTLIEACGFLVGRLLFEIVRINRQRLEFAKLSIIAKDVCAASSNRLAEMSGADVFERETALKMELLREHMKNYVGAEFEYKGSAFVSAVVGVAGKLAGSKP